MTQKIINILIIGLFFINTVDAQELFQKSGKKIVWVNFENQSGSKGSAAMENKGAKGHAFERIAAGDSCTLLSMKGPGIINRIWMTVSERSPEMLRALKIKFYWDDAAKPAVSVPLGDFFCNGLAEMVPYENCFFSDPEGRSMNTNIPMPFRTAARIILVNESAQDLSHLFYDINLTLLDKWNDDMLYFHCYWNQANPTQLGIDHIILPKTKGNGRFLGVSAGIIADSIYEDTWWGEGEIKIYLDGDQNFPSLCGTGVEDYIGTAWGQGQFYNWYQGSPIANPEKRKWSFYRFHVNDPIYFSSDCKITLQQIGGSSYEQVLKLYKANVPLIPVTVDQSINKQFIKLLEYEQTPSLDSPDFPQGWVNFYRRDDISSTAYFYLDKPTIIN